MKYDASPRSIVVSPSIIYHGRQISTLWTPTQWNWRLDEGEDVDGTYEYPSPPGFAADAVHLTDRSGQQPAKSTGERISGKKDRVSHAELCASVPAGQKEDDADKRAGLRKTQEAVVRLH